MSLSRKTFNARVAELDFSMEMPVGFFEPPLPPQEPNFDDPTVSFPLMLTSSPVALALIAVAARPAYADGCVSQWLGYLTSHFGISITEARAGRVGGLLRWHPAMLASGTQVQDGVELAMRFVFLEDGGRLVTAHAMCPKELEASYLGTLQHCIETIELEQPKGPTVPVLPIEMSGTGGTVPTLEVIPHDPELPVPKDAMEVYHRMMEKKRAAALQDALPLAKKGEYDAAESLVKKADDSIMGDVALGKMYTELLRESAGKKHLKATAEALYRRALHWRQRAYPEPHTECEADDYSAGRDQDHAELVGILGYDPGE